MSSGDNSSPGNYGLKDQAMAIQWVHDNIVSFGGNPNRITLMGIESTSPHFANADENLLLFLIKGQSAGASAVHLHLIANKTTQYFQSGVSLSGSAYTSWAIKSRKESRRLTEAVANAVFCPIVDTGEMVECLRNKNPVHLVQAQYGLLVSKCLIPFYYTILKI